MYATIGLKDNGFKSGINDAKEGTARLTSGIGNLVKTIANIKLVSIAFDAVRNSISGAVERYDTLNRFPRVLELMGYSATDAATSTEKLRDGILGLPTALDDIVANAQKLTTLTGNLELATDTTLALNNAFLASGSTTAEASRGLTQYVQQLSKGSVDIVSWRTLQETMGYALSEVSKEMLGAGASSNDLYDALKGGEITFDELNNKIIELSNRTGGFADMAKEASGGIGTSWTNMQIAITRGTASIIGSIDEGFSQTRFKSIQNVIEGFGRGFESALKGIGTVLKPVIANIEVLVPTVLTAVAAFKGFQIVQSVGDMIKAASTAIDGYRAATAIMSTITEKNTAIEILSAAAKDKSAASEAIRTAMKQAGITVDSEGALVTAAGTLATEAEAAAVITSSGAISAKTVIVGLLTGNITLAEAAQWAWNAAMNANPIALIVAGVTALTGGIIVLVRALNQQSEASKQLTDDTERLRNETDDIVGSMESNIKAHEDNMKSIEAEAAASKELADKVRLVAAEGGKSESRKAELAALVKTLNGLMGESVIQYDAENDAITGVGESLDVLIAKRAESARTQAAEERSVEIAKEQMRVSDELRQVQEKRIEAEALLGMTLDEYNAKSYTAVGVSALFGEESVKNYEALKSLTAQEAELTAKQTELGGSFESTTQIIADSMVTQSGAISENAEKVQALAEQYGLTSEEILQDLDDMEMSLGEWAEAQEKATEKQTEKMRELATEYGISVEDIRQELEASGESADEWAKRQEEAYEQQKEALQSYTEAVTDMHNKISEDTKTSVENQLKNLDHNYEASQRFVQNLDTLTERGLDKAIVENWRKAGLDSAGEVATWAKASDKEIIAFNEKFKRNTEQGLEDFRASYASPENLEAVTGMLNDMSTTVNKDKNLTNSMKQLIKDTRATATSQVTSSNFPYVGTQMINGIVSGVKNGRSTLVEAMKNAVKAAVTAAQEAAKISSPSRLFRDEVGIQIMRGWAEGIKNGAKFVMNAIGSAIDDFTDASQISITPEFAELTGGGGAYSRSALQPSFAAASASSAAVVPSITQYIQTVPQTPHEFATATYAQFQQARWR